MSQKPNVLLLQEECYIVSFLAGILQRKFQISTAKDWAQCEKSASTSKFDLFILDYAAIVKRTDSTFKDFIERHTDLPVIIVGQRLEFQSITQNLDAHKNRLFCGDKPIEQNQFLYTCKKAVEARQQKSPSEEGVRPISEGGVDCSVDLKDRLVLTNSRKPISAKLKKVSPKTIKINTPRKVSEGEELMFFVGDEPIILKVANSTPVPGTNPPQYSVELFTSDPSDILKAVRKDGLLGPTKEQANNKEDNELTFSDFPKSVLIADDDPNIGQLLKSLLEEVPKVDFFEDGDAAWQAATKFQYEFLLLDWNLPKLSGLGLFNRFRLSEQYKITPIIIISGFVKKKDFSLLAEFPLTDLVEKPLQKKYLHTRIQALSREAAWFSHQELRIYEFFDKLRDQNITDPNVMLAFVRRSPNPYPLALMAGRIERSLGNYQAAEVLIKFALKGNENMLMALNELGKIYLQTGRNKEAKKILAKALTLSPNNIERLCDLGEVNLKELDIRGAETMFSKAREIDPENPTANSGQKLTRNIKNFMTKTDSIPESYASLLNAIGISMVRSGAYHEGIEHYKSAMAHIYDDPTKAKLLFNLGLGYRRWQNDAEAALWFEKAARLDPEHEKARKHLQDLGKQLPNVQPKAEPKIEPKVDPDAMLDADLDTSDFSLPSEPQSSDDTMEEFMLVDEKDKESASSDNSNNNSNSNSNSNNGTFQKVDPKSKSVAPDMDLSELKSASDKIEELVGLMVAEGVYVGGQIGPLKRLLAAHGPKKFHLAVLDAIANNRPSVPMMSNFLAKIKDEAS